MLGSTHRVRHGNSPVCCCLQNAQIKSMKSSEGGAEATWHGCGCEPARSIRNECCCRFLRGHQVTPASSTATGQLTPGSDLCEMRWGKNIGDPYFCFGEALQLGAGMLDYLSQTSKAVYHPGAPLREASGVTFHRFCSIVATFYRLFKMACSLAFTLFTSILLA